MVHKDLEFLLVAENCDLRILTDYLTMRNNGNIRLTQKSPHSLVNSDAYRNFYPEKLTCMTNNIVNEFRMYGGNTFVNIFRGTGPEYSTILMDVCKKLKVNFNKNSPVEIIELNLLQKILVNSLENMTIEQLSEFASECGIPVQNYTKQAIIASIQVLIKKGGFTSYKIAVIVANSIAKALLGRGLTFAANAGLTKWLSIFAGPIGWTATAIWTAVDIAGPAYRVTIPAVIQIAYMRAKNKKID